MDTDLRSSSTESLLGDTKEGLADVEAAEKEGYKLVKEN